MTKPVTDDQPVQKWSADFEGGAVAISEVELWGEFYKVMWDRAFFGVEVFIGDTLCGKINTDTMNEPFQGTNGFGSNRKEGNGYRVICPTPIMGSSVTV